MIAVTFRPMVAWQGQETLRRGRSQFSASFSATMDLLDREIRALNGQRVVIQLDLNDSDIRLDGWPRAGARPDHPGVALSFESKYGPLRYAADRFDRWQDNLRAIALGLEALRKVDRYGITKSGEQYSGWRQLTAGSGVTTRASAVRILVEWSEWSATDVERDPRAAYRVAAKRAHPDAGGTTEAFASVRAAADFLTGAT